MREAVLLVIAISAFLATLFVPAGEPTPSPLEDDRALGADAPKPGSEAAISAEWSAGETVLERSGDGHFYAETAINGTPINLLVDTGASVVALTASDAKALGIAWVHNEVGVVGSGANGPVSGIPVILERVEIGEHEARNVAGVIIPEGLGVSLLGQSFLQTVDPVRIEGDRMVLGG